MISRRLLPRPLSAEEFSPYGDVIAANSAAQIMSINYGQAQRFHRLAVIDSSPGGQPVISIFRSKPLPLPHRIAVMERHPLGSQTFMPLGTNPFLVIVAKMGDFDPTLIEAFVVPPGIGVNYRSGIWHHFCLALHNVSDFLVIDRDGPGANCDEITLSPSDDVLVMPPESPI